MLMLLFKKDSFFDANSNSYDKSSSPKNNKHVFALMSFTRCSTTVHCFSFQAICFHVANANVQER